MDINEYEQCFKILGLEEERNISESILNERFTKICNELNNQLMEIQNKDSKIITVEDRINQTRIQEKYKELRYSYEKIKRPELLAIRRELFKNKNVSSNELFNVEERVFNKGNKCIGMPDIAEISGVTNIDDRTILSQILEVQFNNGGFMKDTTLKKYILTLMGDKTTGISYKFYSPEIEIAKLKSDENYRTEILKLVNKNCAIKEESYIGYIKETEDGRYIVVNDEGQIDACKKLDSPQKINKTEDRDGLSDR